MVTVGFCLSKGLSFTALLQVWLDNISTKLTARETERVCEKRNEKQRKARQQLAGRIRSF
jgi:hypothetical protein